MIHARFLSSLDDCREKRKPQNIYCPGPTRGAGSRQGHVASHNNAMASQLVSRVARLAQSSPRVMPASTSCSTARTGSELAQPPRILQTCSFSRQQTLLQKPRLLGESCVKGCVGFASRWSLAAEPHCALSFTKLQASLEPGTRLPAMYLEGCLVPRRTAARLWCPATFLSCCRCQPGEQLQVCVIAFLCQEQHGRAPASHVVLVGRSHLHTAWSCWHSWHSLCRSLQYSHTCVVQCPIRVCEHVGRRCRPPCSWWPVSPVPPTPLSFAAAVASASAPPTWYAERAGCTQVWAGRLKGMHRGDSRDLLTAGYAGQGFRALRFPSPCHPRPCMCLRAHR